MTEPRPTLNRAQLLAAEIFGYSYANYQGHLGIGRVRYERLMPESVALLERATGEQWPPARVARELDTDEDNALELLRAYQRAVQIVDAPNPAESFRHAVRGAVQNALAEGLETETAIEALVTQVCYRTADLAYLLDQESTALSRYSRHLRREPNVGYHEGYFTKTTSNHALHPTPAGAIMSRRG